MNCILANLIFLKKPTNWLVSKLWRELKPFAKIIGFSVLAYVLLWFVLSCGLAMAQEAPPTTSYIKVQTKQWNQLKTTLEQQEVKLIALEETLATLKAPSSELRNQLTEVKKDLKESQTELEKANNSLANASSSIDKLKLSLEMLNKQIEKERAVHKRQLQQAKFWNFLKGIVVGVAVDRIVSR